VDPGALERQARTLIDAARRTGVRVVLAGVGPWPELGSNGAGKAWRVRSFEDFDKLLATLSVPAHDRVLARR
jgi:hypothetical protein